MWCAWHHPVDRRRVARGPGVLHRTGETTPPADPVTVRRPLLQPPGQGLVVHRHDEGRGPGQTTAGGPARLVRCLGTFDDLQQGVGTATPRAPRVTTGHARLVDLLARCRQAVDRCPQTRGVRLVEVHLEAHQPGGQGPFGEGRALLGQIVPVVQTIPTETGLDLTGQLQQVPARGALTQRVQPSRVAKEVAQHLGTIGPGQQREVAVGLPQHGVPRGHRDGAFPDGVREGHRAGFAERLGHLRQGVGAPGLGDARLLTHPGRGPRRPGGVHDSALVGLRGDARHGGLGGPHQLPQQADGRSQVVRSHAPQETTDRSQVGGDAGDALEQLHRIRYLRPAPLHPCAGPDRTPLRTVRS